MAVSAFSIGRIYTSTDSGVSWTARDSARSWTAVASSSDGTKLVAGASNGQIYTIIYTAATAAQVIAAVNAASLGVTLTNTGTSNGSAAVSAAAQTNLTGGIVTTTLSGTQTANRAIAFPDASGTLALTTDYLPLAGGTMTGDIIAGTNGGELRDFNNVVSLDWDARQLIGTDGSTHNVMLDWSDLGTVNFNDANLSSVNSCYATGFYGGTIETPSYASFPDGIGDTTGLVIDIPNYQLLANDEVTSTVMLDWATPNSMMLMGASILSDGAGALEFTAGTLIPSIYAGTFAGGFTLAIDVENRNLYASDGTTVTADWTTGSILNAPNGFSAPAVNLAPNSVAALAGLGEGTISYVNDADTPAIGSAVVGDGSAKCLVCYNGTDWIVTALL